MTPAPHATAPVTDADTAWAKQWMTHSFPSAKLFDNRVQSLAQARATIREEAAREMRKALMPFSAFAGTDLCKNPQTHDDVIILSLPGDVIGLRGGYQINVGHFRTASKALGDEPTSPPTSESHSQPSA